jgi:hypothetical protein
VQRRAQEGEGMSDRINIAALRDQAERVKREVEVGGVHLSHSNYFPYDLVLALVEAVEAAHRVTEEVSWSWNDLHAALAKFDFDGSTAQTETQRV